MAAFCHQCGARATGDSRFCQKCGAAISVTEPMLDKQGPAMEPIPSKLQPKARKSKFKTLLKIGGLMGAVVVLAIVILMAATPDAPLSPQAVRDAAALKAADDKDAADKAAANVPSDVEKPQVPGQSDAEAADLAVPHVFLTPEKPVPQQDSNSSGVMFLTFPWHDPILRGSVVAARNTEGFGAVIYPDENTFAAIMNATFQGTNNDTKKPTDNWHLLRRFGGSYVPPGTPMVSEGGNAAGSLVVVTATLPDGRTVSGVTDPSSIVRAQQQIETANHQVQVQPPNLHAESSEASQKPAPVPLENSKPSASQPLTASNQVENPTPPAQPPSVPEIDRQAIALWNQKRYSDAIPLFNQACSGGKTDSCYRLGLMYDFGQGAAQDSSRAAAFYSKSCNAGNGAACYHLSMLQQYQPGGAVCNSSAMRLNLSRSCDTGIATSCSIVGYSYIHGCGVAKDTEKGRQLLSKGCSLGDYNVCDGIK